MMWKHIEQSVAGTSHISSRKACEDAVACIIIPKNEKEQILLCCASDGAGSALYGGWASAYMVSNSIAILEDRIKQEAQINEASIFELLETLYNAIKQVSVINEVPLNEYSATLLCAIILPQKALFFQIGDGAIVYNDGAGFYVPVFAPQNGEFLNNTSFLIDDPAFGQLQCMVTDIRVDELALFTDGLQQLALNSADNSVYQPFFSSLFPALRKADEKNNIEILSQKLAAYLNGESINDRTDDDKTLLLATRLPA